MAAIGASYHRIGRNDCLGPGLMNDATNSVEGFALGKRCSGGVVALEALYLNVVVFTNLFDLGKDCISCIAGSKAVVRHHICHGRNHIYSF